MLLVSIPDRVLGIFRLESDTQAIHRIEVSIPDRVLGIFRLWMREFFARATDGFNP